MRLFGADRILAVVEALRMPEDQPIDAAILSNSIESAQKRIEGTNFERRKNVLQYDDVINLQREIIYKERRAVLDGDDISGKISKMIDDHIEETLSSFAQSDVADEWDFDGMRNAFKGLLTTDDDFRYNQAELGDLQLSDVCKIVSERAQEMLKKQEELFPPEIFSEVERAILLRNVDSRWVEHIDAMDDLKGSVGLNAYAQRNPVVEYKIQGGIMFEEMISEIRSGTVRMILSARPRNASTERQQVLNGSASMQTDGKKVKPTPAKKVEKAGPNDPCPCGSGKKYKKCCMGSDK
jgi:preprotein translocase subunit SecA